MSSVLPGAAETITRGGRLGRQVSASDGPAQVTTVPAASRSRRVGVVRGLIIINLSDGGVTRKYLLSWPCHDDAVATGRRGRLIDLGSLRGTTLLYAWCH